MRDAVRGVGGFGDEVDRCHTEGARQFRQQRQRWILSTALEVGHAGPAKTDAFGELGLGDASSFAQAADGRSEVDHEIAGHATTVTHSCE